MPRRAITLTVVPVIASAIATPINESGTVVPMISGSTSDSNWLAMTMYTSTIPARMASPRYRNDSRRSSAPPPTSMMTSLGMLSLLIAFSTSFVTLPRSRPETPMETVATRP
ncbi:MAG: hypothetical protein BWY06_03154 [Candidatus Latescibacteria bacterium ADurb.Bin168]|nr:MAG: hypothetical protein BWY06_03154 [Candidatus Latescibacteria bacterium ADurb.Bin168]